MMKNTKRYMLLFIFMLLLCFSSFSVNAATIKLKSITLNKTSITLNKGQTYQLSVTYNPTNATITSTKWTSSNTSVASVTNGKVLAKAPGTSVITVQVNGKSLTCKVVVKAPITSLKLSETSVSLNVGQGKGICVYFSPANTTDSKTVTWTSSNTKVATVSGGNIKAVGAGTATITAKMGSKTATIKVTVKKVAPKYVSTTECYNTLATYRKNAKVGTVKRDTTLENLAKIRAKELATKYSHERPDGTRGVRIIPGNIYKGENIGKGQKTCAAIMTGWFNSESHRNNMLGKHYTKVGIAGYEVDGVIYWVMLLSS